MEGGAGHCRWPSLLCPHPVPLQHQVPQPAGTGLAWSEAGTGGFPSVGLIGLRTAMVLAFENQITNASALFREGICCIYRIIKTHDLEVSWSKIWIVILLKLMQNEPQTIDVGARIWHSCVNLLKEVAS